jgi:hypothetical protein
VTMDVAELWHVIKKEQLQAPQMGDQLAIW